MWLLILTLGVAASTAVLGWRMLVGTRVPAGLRGLPLRVVPVSPDLDRSPGAPGHLVVFLTSDSGYLQLNRSLPDGLARAGHPVVAWNSLRYYLRSRSPDEAAEDLERILTELCPAPNAPWSIVGYSFGAGVLPFLVNRLPPERLRGLRSVVYLAYPGVAMFRFKISGWLLRLDEAALPATDEVARLPRVPSLCVAGESDPIRDCRSIEPFGVRRHLLELGHGLHPDSETVTELVLESLEEGLRSSRLSEPPTDREPGG